MRRRTYDDVHNLAMLHYTLTASPRARHVLEPNGKRVVGFGVVWGMRNGSDACDKPGHEVRKSGRSHSDLMALIFKARFGER